MKTQMKSRALLLVCVLLLVTALVAVFAVGASAADVTELNDYALVLNDGVDIKVTGTVAEADLESEIQVITTCHGETAYDVTVEDGAFEVQIPVSATYMAESIRVDLVVDGDIVDTQTVSINAYAAAILADEETPAGVKQLISDVIRYGQAVLTYAGAEDEAAALAEGLELIGSAEYDAPANTVTEGGEAGTVAINQIAMELNGRINFLLTTDVAVDDYTVKADGYETVVDGTTVKVVGIPVSAYYEGITVGIYDAEDALVSNEICYSPAGYLMAMYDAYMSRYEGSEETPSAMEIKVFNVLVTLYEYANTVHLLTDHEVTVTTSVATCAAEGLKASECDICGYYEEEILPVDAAVHAELTYTVAGDQITYTCADCEASWTSTTLALADGTSTSKFEGNATNAGYVGCTDKPAMVDGHYELVKGETPATAQAQFYLVSGKGTGAVANRLGFVSVSLTAVDVPLNNGKAGWALKLCNSSGAWTNIKGQAKGMDVLVGDPTDGSVALTMGGVKIALAADAYTRIDISFVPMENDTYLLTYYADGVAVDVVTVDNILLNYTPNKLYFTSGAVTYVEDADAQPAIKFDDLTLAFTDGTKDEFFPKNHVHVAGEEAVQIDGENHAFMCTGCDATVTVAKHVYDFSGATCASGVATGTCVCGATTTTSVEHTLAVTGIADKVVTYQCSVCEGEYTIAAAWTQDFSGTRMTVNAGSYELVDGGQKIIGDPAKDADPANPSNIGNATIQQTTNNQITSATDAIYGFDLKNTDTRAAAFVVQVKIQNDKNAWGYNTTAMKLQVAADGSVTFNEKATGYKISKDAYTSFVMKIHLDVTDTNSTLTTQLWINGQYVDSVSATVAGGTNATLLNSNSYLQWCVVNFAGENAMIVDNLYLAEVPANAQGNAITAYLTEK